MNNSTVTTQHCSFRWDTEKKLLLVTSQREQMQITADKVLELLEHLYQNREDIYRASQDLPEWVYEKPPAPTRQLPELHAAGGTSN